MRPRPPRSTLTDTLFPYTTLFRSNVSLGGCWPISRIPFPAEVSARPFRRTNVRRRSFDACIPIMLTETPFSCPIRLSFLAADFGVLVGDGRGHYEDSDSPDSHRFSRRRVRPRREQVRVLSSARRGRASHHRASALAGRRLLPR